MKDQIGHKCAMWTDNLIWLKIPYKSYNNIMWVLYVLDKELDIPGSITYLGIITQCLISWFEQFLYTNLTTNSGKISFFLFKT